jgi:hypothetical protein
MMQVDVQLWVATHETKYGVDAHVFTSREEMEAARDSFVDTSREENWEYSIHTVTVEVE